jgi:hypothetical protein
MKVLALSRAFWSTPPCALGQERHFALVGKTLFIADPGSLLIFAGGTRSDPAIYSATTSTMITASNSLVGSGTPNQFDGDELHTMNQLRAIPRANRTSESAHNPIPCATSSTGGPLVCGPWPPGRSDVPGASLSAETDVASPAHSEPRRGPTRPAKIEAACCLAG